MVKRTGIVVAILVVLWVVFWPKFAPLFQEVPETASTGTERLPVEAVVVQPEMLDNVIHTSGSIQANESVELRAEMSGVVREIRFEEGGHVSGNELLVKIDDRELQAERRRIEARLQLAQESADRQSRLLERGGVSRQEYDNILNEVRVLQAELDLVDARIAKTEIRAPFQGRIGLKYISDGSFVTPETRIASLHDLDRVKIDFSIPERYVADVQEGDRIDFRVQGRDSTYSGSVYAIEPGVNPSTRTLQIRARSENPDHELLPGAFANIELNLERIQDALMVPTIAVIPGFERQTSWVWRDGRVEEVEVRTGIRLNDAVQIVQGVAPGDTVLTTGLLQVRPGMEIDITSLTQSPNR
ncbi:MAG: efflux RND transporter periplasmic adaptor subunit [Balneolaceae bacterium]